MENIRYRDIQDRWQYTFDCPVGVWRGYLDAKAWGKKSNVLLYLSELETGKKYAISVFWTRGHQPEQGGLNLRLRGEPGDLLELETAKTRTGTSKLVAARIISLDELTASAVTTESS